MQEKTAGEWSYGSLHLNWLKLTWQSDTGPDSSAPVGGLHTALLCYMSSINERKH